MDTGSSFNSISQTVLSLFSHTIHPKAFSSSTHTFDTSLGVTKSIGEVVLYVSSDFFPSTYMVFSITATGHTVIGRLQILLFSNSAIIKIIRHEQNLQFTQQSSHIPDDIHKFISDNLHPTVPFRHTDYSFSLGTLIDPAAPSLQTFIPSFFLKNVVALQSFISEQLNLEIIEQGKPGD